MPNIGSVFLTSTRDRMLCISTFLKLSTPSLALSLITMDPSDKPEKPEAGPSTPAQKQPKAPKPPKQSSSAGAPGADGAGKGKSAKDLKKEKRAAAVAARGGGHDPRQDAAQAAQSGPSSAAPSAGPSTAGAHPGAQAPRGGAVPTRPPIMANESAAPFVVKQQNLFFSHLPTSTPQPTSQALKSGKLHPLVLRLGVLMSSGTLRGANARTMAMMIAFKEVIRDYESPEQAVLWKDLMGHMSPMIGWLESCRSKGVGGGNAIRWLKGEINKLGEEGSALSELSERDVRYLYLQCDDLRLTIGSKSSI